MIRIACPGCSATFTVPDDRAGQTTNCSKCKAPFQIPGEPPPRTAILLDAEPGVDDGPRLVARRAAPDDRPRRRRDEDEQPRRRRCGDDEPRRKPAASNGLLIACGIVCIIGALLIGALAIYDVMQFERIDEAAAARGPRQRSPFPEFQRMDDQLDTAFSVNRAAVYCSLVAAFVYFAAGVGMIMQKAFGRYTGFAAGGLSCIAIAGYLFYSHLLHTVEIPAAPPRPSPGLSTRELIHIGLHVLPVVFVAIAGFATGRRRLR